MYRVVKVSQEFQGHGMVAPSRETILVPGGGSKESALILAEVAALEHAEMIGVDYKAWGNLKSVQTGFWLRTNNGTDVWYVVKLNPNAGHGHVLPRPDGMRARCGGPSLCKECQKEAQTHGIHFPISR